MALVNGKIYTMDGSKRVVSQALIQNGRFTAVGNNAARRGNVKVVDPKGHTGVQKAKCIRGAALLCRPRHHRRREDRQ